VCSQLLEAASIFEMCDLNCTELLERLERLKRADPSSDLVEYFHTFADERISFSIKFFFYRISLTDVSVKIFIALRSPFSK
jgi:hypothetical protein